jgi:hypothetical protein
MALAAGAKGVGVGSAVNKLNVQVHILTCVTCSTYMYFTTVSTVCVADLKYRMLT